ncbi:MAG: response regulator transcription factor [Gemmatimonadetes bacterium]|nr:response regulator transcription factor [Gemmatimonadota bacterium]
MTPTPVTIWIVEDRDTLREAYTAVIESAEGLACGGAFRTCEDMLDALEAHEAPDVVLMDIELPGMSGIEGVRKIREARPETDVLMLTIREDRENVFQALCAGAAGYVVKPASARGILTAIDGLLEGEVPMSPSIARRVLKIFRGLRTPRRDYGLSKREREVLKQLVQARSTPEIARTLFISEHTVGNHVRNIYRKLEVHTRAGVVAKAVRERLVVSEGE